jgi:hypothetical protein
MRNLRVWESATHHKVFLMTSLSSIFQNLGLSDEIPKKVTPDVIKFKVFHKLVVIIAATIVITILSYAIVATFLNKFDTVGEALVNVEFPPTQDSPLYGKPVSYLMAAGVALVFSGYELLKSWFTRQSSVRLSIFKLLAFTTAVLAAYEVFYNFAIWTAQIGSTVTAGDFLVQLSPDQIVNPFPNPNAPWNLVFATKLSVLILGVAVYTFFFVRQIEREKEPLRLTPKLLRQLRQLESRLVLEDEEAAAVRSASYQLTVTEQLEEEDIFEKENRIKSINSPSPSEGVSRPVEKDDHNPTNK